MNQIFEVDVITKLNNLVDALIPFAQSKLVSLNFNARSKNIKFLYHPSEICIAQSCLVFSTLLCNIIKITPPGQSVDLNATMINKFQSFYLRLQIQISSFHNNDLIGDIDKLCKFPIIVLNQMGGTTYELYWPMDHKIDPFIKNNFVQSKIETTIKGENAKIRNQKRALFADIDYEISLLAIGESQDAIFIQEVDSCILAHLEDEKFDVNNLSRYLAMSRTQLFRLFKKCINESPAAYIRFFRLQKAKEMLEKTTYSIGEIASKTGFHDHSHFSRSFRELFGVLPSSFRLQKKL